MAINRNAKNIATQMRSPETAQTQFRVLIGDGLLEARALRARTQPAPPALPSRL